MPGKMITISDSNAHLYQDDLKVAGKKRVRGLIPRVFKDRPLGCYGAAPEFDIDPIPESEWEDRLQEQVKNKSSLSDVRAVGMSGKQIPSTDQDGIGYCWCHSTTSAALVLRASAGQPFADLSAFSVGSIIKNYKNQGGWNAEAVDFMAGRGVAISKYWPHRSRDRKHDNPETWANAKLHRFTEWWDLDPRDMKRQLVTCLLLGFPVASDFNWWGHSVATLKIVSFKPFRTQIWNSWGQQWSEDGEGILEGSKAIPNAAIACRVVTSSED